MILMAEIGIISSCEIMYTHGVIQITMLLAMGITTQMVGSIRLTKHNWAWSNRKENILKECTKLLEYSNYSIKRLTMVLDSRYVY